jgi:hypothetical protein
VRPLRQRRRRRAAIAALRALVCIVCVAGAGAVCADEKSTLQEAPSKFFDAADGWLDFSGFLDTAYGFVPIVSPITEPAVGYGAVGALVFIDRDPASAGQSYTRPNIAAVGGLATENGTRGVFAGHLGTWLDGRLRTQVAVADADVNLEYFGLGGERSSGKGGLGYTIGARGGMTGGSYRMGDAPVWFGLRYALVNTSVSVDRPDFGLPGITAEDFDLRLAALTPSVTLDMRDNFFTPTRGGYVDLSVPLFREALGSDRDFEKATLSAMYYQPLSRMVFFGVRAAGKTSSDGTPFYLRPYVALRGVQALRYQGERAAEAEVELRWQLHARFSLVAFAGAGVARSELAQRDRSQSVVAGGAGFRYLLARKHGLHMGIDVAAGPDNPILYVVFGSAWLRP